MLLYQLTSKLSARIILLALAAISLSVTAEAEGPNFRGIGFLPETDRSEAYGVSDDGSAVAGWSMFTSPEAAYWTDESGLQGLGIFP